MRFGINMFAICVGAVYANKAYVGLTDPTETSVIKCNRFIGSGYEHDTYECHQGNHNVVARFRQKNPKLPTNFSMETEKEYIKKLRFNLINASIEHFSLPVVVPTKNIDMSGVSKFNKRLVMSWVKIESYIDGKPIVDFDYTLLKYLTLSSANKKIFELCNQLIDAVETLHKCDVYHNDLTSSNIFYSETSGIIISDFSTICFREGCKISANPKMFDDRFKPINVNDVSDRDMYYVNRRIIEILTKYLKIAFDNFDFTSKNKSNKIDAMNQMIAFVKLHRLSFSDLRKYVGDFVGEESVPAQSVILKENSREL